jgi:hypothetical protein
LGSPSSRKNKSRVSFNMDDQHRDSGFGGTSSPACGSRSNNFDSSGFGGMGSPPRGNHDHGDFGSRDQRRFDSDGFGSTSNEFGADQARDDFARSSRIGYSSRHDDPNGYSGSDVARSSRHGFGGRSDDRNGRGYGDAFDDLEGSSRMGNRTRERDRTLYPSPPPSALDIALDRAAGDSRGFYEAERGDRTAGYFPYTRGRGTSPWNSNGYPNSSFFDGNVATSARERNPYYFAGLPQVPPTQSYVNAKWNPFEGIQRHWGESEAEQGFDSVWTPPGMPSPQGFATPLACGGGRTRPGRHQPSWQSRHDCFEPPEMGNQDYTTSPESAAKALMTKIRYLGAELGRPAPRAGFLKVVMRDPLQGGRLGLALKGTTVLDVTDPRSRHLGWERGDRIMAVNASPVSGLQDFHAELQGALSEHWSNGRPLVFDVWRPPHDAASHSVRAPSPSVSSLAAHRAARRSLSPRHVPQSSSNGCGHGTGLHSGHVAPGHDRAGACHTGPMVHGLHDQGLHSPPVHEHPALHEHGLHGPPVHEQHYAPHEHGLHGPAMHEHHALHEHGVRGPCMHDRGLPLHGSHLAPPLR